MSIFKRVFTPKTKSADEIIINNSHFPLTTDEKFTTLYISPFKTAFLFTAWVNIAIYLLIRNVARADFVLEREGVELKSGSLFVLFHKPNERLSYYDLWKKTAAWRFIEGEAFWRLGPDYSGGLPKQLHVLNPRKLLLEGGGLDVGKHSLLGGFENKNRYWFCNTGFELTPVFSDEPVHFKTCKPNGKAGT
jgi:hypothetical protein